MASKACCAFTGLVLILNIGFMHVICSVISNKCSSNATTPNLQKQYSDWLLKSETDLDSSFFFHEQYFENIKHHKNFRIAEIGKDDKDYGIIGDRHCPTRREIKRKGKRKKSKGPEFLMDRAICPWYILISYDEKRFPQTIARAHCKCTKCLPPEKWRKRRRCSKRTGYCEPIEIQKKVLRQKQTSNGEPFCQDNVIQYVETFETVQVACACAGGKRGIPSQEPTAKTPQKR